MRLEKIIFVLAKIYYSLLFAVVSIVTIQLKTEEAETKYTGMGICIQMILWMYIGSECQ